jgi:hypothetical protein
MAHLLSQLPYAEMQRDPAVLPARVHNPGYERDDPPDEMYVPEIY